MMTPEQRFSAVNVILMNKARNRIVYQGNIDDADGACQADVTAFATRASLDVPDTLRRYEEYVTYFLVQR